MKNALDEIECIPTEGNRTPPYQIISHPYCVDIISTYVSISNLEFENKENSLALIKEGIEYYCTSNNINFNYHFDNKLPLVISPTTNNFQWFLGLQIVGSDIHKINALLSFQHTRFNEDEVDFITFVEFSVYKIVKNFSSSHNSGCLRVLMEWVNSQRVKNINQSASSQLTSENTKIKPIISKSNTKAKSKAIEPSFSLNGLIKDPDYFVTHATTFMDAFKLLKGGGFISSETDYECFKSILSSKVILRKDRIDWTGKIKDLNRFIVLLMQYKIIRKIRYKWETTCNCFTYNESDYNPEMLRKANSKNNNEDKLLVIIKKLQTAI